MDHRIHLSAETSFPECAERVMFTMATAPFHPLHGASKETIFMGCLGPIGRREDKKGWDKKASLKTHRQAGVAEAGWPVGRELQKVGV